MTIISVIPTLWRDLAHCLDGIPCKGYTFGAFFMPKNDQGKYIVFALRAAADMTGTILVPAVVAAFAGKFLDTHFGPGRAFFVLVLAVTALLTVWMLVRKSKSYGEAFKKLVEEPGNGSARR